MLEVGRVYLFMNSKEFDFFDRATVEGGKNKITNACITRKTLVGVTVEQIMMP